MTRWAGVPEDRQQAVLFAERLDDAVPAEHSVRLLDELLGRPEIDWKPWELRYHRTLGQPAVHPRVPASILLYGLMTRIRSSRGLEDALGVRLDFRWLAHGHRLDHTMLSEFRRKHTSELKSLFVDVLLLAKELGLSHFQRIGFDGTRTRANNRRSGTRTPAELLAEQQKLQQEVDEFLQQAESADARDEELFGRDSFSDMPQELRDKQRRAEKIGEALADLARLKEAGGKAPKRIPTTDLDARVMPNKDGGCAPNYTPLATVDIATGLIVADDVRGMPAACRERRTRRTIRRTARRTIQRKTNHAAAPSRENNTNGAASATPKRWRRRKLKTSTRCVATPASARSR